MNRRDTIKSLLLGSVAAGFVLNGCTTEVIKEKATFLNVDLQGQTPEEIERDEKLLNDSFFNEHELTTIAVLCDIILPSNTRLGSATDAGVDEFIEFIVKDMTYQQTPIRGGLMWLDGYSNRLFNK